ncbi:MAG TPA: AsmA-like C-terminal region-containing protein, partial [Aquabacterium sp.]|nr:AsmA-like C-terminal region-containing protein [Aquabacterium sp.]
MRVVDTTAVLGSVGSGTYALKNVSGRIADLDHPDPVLTIQGEGSGPLNDLLQYMAVSPVGEWTGQMLGQAQGQGRGNLTLALTLPINHIADAQVHGQVTLSDKDQASLRLAPGVPMMHNARGQVQFTQDMLKVSARTRVWGQEVQVQGSRDAQGVPRFQASGLVSAEGLRSASEWPAVARLAQRMSGQTPVSVSVALTRIKSPKGGVSGFSARPELQVSSTLQGLGLDLPAPMNKEAAATWPLKVIHRHDDPEGKSDTLQVDLSGPVLLKADYRRDLKGPQPKVQRGTLSLSQGATPAPMPLPPSGVMARILLPTLDLEAWQQVGQLLTAGAPTGAAGPDPSEDFLPDTLSLKVDAMSWRQRTLRQVAVTLAHPGPGIWRAQIDAQQLAGQIEMRPESAAALPSGAGPTSRVVARLSRLSVPAADAEAFTDQAAQQMLSTEAASVPALDIVIDQFDWRGVPLGKLEVEAVNRLNISPGNPPLPEWRLTKLRLSNTDAQLSATGNWTALGAQQAAATPLRKGVRARHRAAFSFALDLHNSGNLLNRLGMPQTLKGGKGKMSGQVAWLGSPLEPDASSMNGDVTVNINEGQFLKAEPGVAKLLGVLSLQSLPRRLILDFRDVFQQGFAFDRIEGDVKITQGVAATRNLRMRGVQALVLMEGQADLSQETQNLRVFVVPEINAGTASLAYAAINPAIGLGTFIAQVLLRKSIVEASTREFTITGSWADPQVDRV